LIEGPPAAFRSNLGAPADHPALVWPAGESGLRPGFPRVASLPGRWGTQPTRLRFHTCARFSTDVIRALAPGPLPTLVSLTSILLVPSAISPRLTLGPFFANRCRHVRPNPRFPASRAPARATPLLKPARTPLGVGATRRPPQAESSRARSARDHSRRGSVLVHASTRGWRRCSFNAPR